MIPSNVQSSSDETRVFSMGLYVTFIAQGENYLARRPNHGIALAQVWTFTAIFKGKKGLRHARLICLAGTK
jgi:hypothetical protein